MKQKIFKTFEGLEELSVFIHYCISLFTFWNFYDMKKSEKLADELNEFWYLPLPHGALANDLV